MRFKQTKMAINKKVTVQTATFSIGKNSEFI
jgi:hypothetical protein